MAETKLAKAPWPKPKKPAKMTPNDKRIDVKFNEWAKRNNINLKDLQVMHDTRR